MTHIKIKGTFKTSTGQEVIDPIAVGRMYSFDRQTKVCGCAWSIYASKDAYDKGLSPFNLLDAEDKIIPQTGNREHYDLPIAVEGKDSIPAMDEEGSLAANELVVITQRLDQLGLEYELVIG